MGSLPVAGISWSFPLWNSKISDGSLRVKAKGLRERLKYSGNGLTVGSEWRCLEVLNEVLLVQSAKILCSIQFAEHRIVNEGAKWLHKVIDESETVTSTTMENT